MSLRTQLCCFFINDTAEWLSGFDGSKRTRDLKEAVLIQPTDIEGFLKANNILANIQESISIHLLEANFSLKRKIKLS